MAGSYSVADDPNLDFVAWSVAADRIEPLDGRQPTQEQITRLKLPARSRVPRFSAKSNMQRVDLAVGIFQPHLDPLPLQNTQRMRIGVPRGAPEAVAVDLAHGDLVQALDVDDAGA